MIRFRVETGFLALLVALAARSGSSQTITEFPIPTPASGSHSIAAGPDGNVWFAEFDGNRIGRITPAGVVTEFPLPTPASFPASIARGPDGNLWFTENGTNRIGRITPAGTITEFPVPSGFPSGGPAEIAAGPDGALWFTETDGGTGGRVRRITTAGQVTLFAPPNPSQSPHQIVAGPDGNLWYSMPVSGRIGRVSTAGAVVEFPIPTPATDSLALSSGPDGAVWIAEHLPAGDRLGRVAADGSIAEVPIPPITSSVRGMTAGPDGNLWLTEYDTGRIARATTSGTVTEFPLAAGSHPWGITAGPDGAIWFVETDANKIGRITTGPTGPCAPDPNALCLSGGRFRVTAAWRSSAASGTGAAVRLTDDSGYFWFFSANNIEMVVKTLDGCGFNSRFWVFAGGLTNVEVILTVTDLHAGATRSYVNPLGTPFQPLQDTSAFPTCP